MENRYSFLAAIRAGALRMRFLRLPPADEGAAPFDFDQLARDLAGGDLRDDVAIVVIRRP